MEHRKEALRTNTFLHWFVGFSFVLIFSIGYFKDEFKNTYYENIVLDLHETLGLLFIILAVLRIIWRIKAGRIYENPLLPYWQEKLSKIIKYFLLFFVIGMPITGLMMSIGEGLGINFLGFYFFATGTPMPEVSELGELLHETFADGILIVFGLHLLDTIKFIYIDRPMLRKRLEDG